MDENNTNYYMNDYMKAHKKEKKNAIIVTLIVVIIMGFIISLPLLFFKLLVASQWHDININSRFADMEDEFFKEILDKEFNLDDDTYITKIKYTSGFDDGNVYRVCVYYDDKEKCKESSTGYGRYKE